MNQSAVELAEIIQSRTQWESGDHGSQRSNGGTLDVIAPSDGEREPVALVAVIGVSPQHHIRGRVVGVRVHRIRTVQTQGRRKTDIGCLEVDDLGSAHDSLLCPPDIRWFMLESNDLITSWNVVLQSVDDNMRLGWTA